MVTARVFGMFANAMWAGGASYWITSLEEWLRAYIQQFQPYNQRYSHSVTNTL